MKNVDMQQKTCMCVGGGTPRSGWIDVMRGIAILLVVLGHTKGYLEDPINRFILSFHMPAFFFISGLVAKTKKDGEMISFTRYMAHKARTILLPQLVLAIVLTVYNVVAEHNVPTIGMIVGNLFSWFLIVLFYVSILFWFLDRFNFLIYKIVCLAVVLLLVITIDLIELSTIINIEIVPAALLFYLLGYYTRPFLETKQSIKPHWVISIPLIVIVSSINTPVAMYNNDYGNIGLFLISSCFGVWLLYGLSRALEDNPILQWFGKNSVIIYVLHFRLLNVLRGIGKTMLPQIEGSTFDYPVSWYIFICAILIMVPCTLFINRFLPFLFGKDKKQQSSN